MSEPKDLRELLAQASKAAQSRRLDEAAALIEEVLERDPDNLRALDLFGFVRFFQGRYEEAEGYCRRAVELAPDHAYARKGLGLNLARQGRLDEGQAELERAISLKPGWFDPYWDLAVVLSEGGRKEEALKVLAQGQVAVPSRRTQLLAFAKRIEQK